MNKTIAVLLLLLAVGAAATFLIVGGGDDAKPPELPSAGAPTPEVTEPEPGATLTAREEEPAQQERTPANAREQVWTDDSGASQAQGIKGQIVDPDGQPIADNIVYLVEGASGNLIEQLKRTQQGAIVPPVARTTTDANGNFSLGVERISSLTYEVRAISNTYVDHIIPNITVTKGRWFDAGVIKLERGGVLQGRVTIKGSSGLPAPNAKVMVKANSLIPTFTPTPEREDGLVAEVDHTGFYRIENAPHGAVTVAAVAPGYARIEKPGVMVNKHRTNETNFELPPGLSIAGVVRDEEQQPIANVKIEAMAMSTRTPSKNVTRSDRDGKFEIIGLVDGPYLLTAHAKGFVRWQYKPIRAGETDVDIVMERQGAARLRVYDKNNRLLTGRYRVAVKRYFPAHEATGNAMGSNVIEPHAVRPDRSGVGRVEGLDPGSYMFQVDHDGHARSFSEAFTIAQGQEEPLLDVHLNTGGNIQGLVLGSQGEPLAGVTVETLPNEYGDNPFTQMFGSVIPTKVTRTKTKTNAKGEYRVSLLNEAVYQLKFTHPDHSDTSIKGLEVVAGEVTSVTQISMSRGTIVSGVVRVDGAPTAQVKVTVNVMPEPGMDRNLLTTFEAITDNNGKFTLAKRVPPGRYQAMAARQTTPNPLLQIADFHKTKQEFSIANGQATYNLQINIASQ